LDKPEKNDRNWALVPDFFSLALLPVLGVAVAVYGSLVLIGTFGEMHDAIFFDQKRCSELPV
jgi:hypothetical protein